MKSIFAALLVISAVTAENLCTPGAFFKVDCNTCACSSDGKSAACTDMACPHEGNANVNDINTVQAQPKQVCKPGSQFNDYCNLCTCSTDGTFSICTRMYCDKNIWNKDGSLRIITRSNNAIEKVGRQVCSPNSHFKEECNTCICSQDGLSKACTMMTCKMGGPITDSLSSKKQVCTPNSHFKEECNTCICSQDGLSKACTMMTCNMGGPITDYRSSKNQVCTPNSQFKEECNTCVCSQDGFSKACTMMTCNIGGPITDSSSKICEPGKAYSPDGCNTCICSLDGTQSACTFKLCLPGLKKAYEDEEADKWGPLYKQGNVCAPGKAFYSECNRCVCGATGRSAFCTLMSCQDKSIRN